MSKYGINDFIVFCVIQNMIMRTKIIFLWQIFQKLQSRYFRVVQYPTSGDDGHCQKILSLGIFWDFVPGC